MKAGAVNDSANKAAADAQKAKDVLEARYKEASNNFDGLLHGANGNEHPEGGLVSGANQLHQKKNQQKLFDINAFESMDEQEEHQIEVRNARVQAVKNEKMRQVQEARAQQARQQRDYKLNKRLHQKQVHVNAFDGLVYMPDGTRVFPDGSPVDGVNDYVQLGSRDVVEDAGASWSEKDQYEREVAASEIVASKRKVELMQREVDQSKTAAKAQINEFDGLIHNADGSRSFADGTPVSGSNIGFS